MTLALQRGARAAELLLRLQVSSSVLRQLWGTTDSSDMLVGGAERSDSENSIISSVHLKIHQINFSSVIFSFRANMAAALLQIKVQSLNGDQSHFSTESKAILFNCPSSKSTRQVIPLRDNGGIKPKATWWRASLNIMTSVKRLRGEKWVTALAWTHISGDFKKYDERPPGSIQPGYSGADSRKERGEGWRIGHRRPYNGHT